MGSFDAIMIAGLGLTVAGGILGLVSALRRDRGQVLHAKDFGPRLDLCMFLVWGGNLLVQASNILSHRQSGTLYNVSMFGWAGTAGDIFICGFFLGRLVLRREKRLYTLT